MRTILGIRFESLCDQQPLSSGVASYSNLSMRTISLAPGSSPCAPSKLSILCFGILLLTFQCGPSLLASGSSPCAPNMFLCAQQTLSNLYILPWPIPFNADHLFSIRFESLCAQQALPNLYPLPWSLILTFQYGPSLWHKVRVPVRLASSS
jgi:hypothetical protein